MYGNYLAVMVSTKRMPQDAEKAREEVWGTVTNLLLPNLGKAYDKFYPSECAWGHRISEPFSVILGREAPERFLALYLRACRAQSSAIHFHTEELVKTVDPRLLEQAMREHTPFCTVEIDGSDPAQTTHALWQVALHDGLLLPDCGVYYADLGKALASPDEQKKVLNNPAGYALCMVTLEFREGENG